MNMKIIAALVLIAVLVATGYILYTKSKKKLGQTTIPTPDTGSGAPTNTQTPTGTITGGSVTVKITATDAHDPYPRDWNIFDKDPSGTYIGGGKWNAATPLQQTVLTSGASWTVTLTKGKTYYLVIGCSDGVSTYSGTITPTGSSPIAFSSNDVNHASAFGV